MKILKIVLKNKNYKIKNLYNGRLNKTGGRNNKGRITLRSRGGGFKQLSRLINFKHLLWNISGIILTVEYSVKRTGFVSLICYSNGILSYMLSTEGVKSGDLISVGKNLKSENLSKGDVTFIGNLNDGTILHSLEVSYLKGSTIARAAGTNVQVIKVHYSHNMSLVRLPSGCERLVPKNCIGVIGQVSNNKHFLKRLRKAGQNRNLGKRSSVRGVAMNPIDHPHGGGEGKTSGAGGRRSQVTFKGLPAKGKPTRSKKKKNPFILVYKRNIKN